MTTVAIVGGDGAGKTTIARHLTTSTDIRAKYLYLGMSAQSGDRLLPTSRIVLMLKRRSYRRELAVTSGATGAAKRIPADRYEYSPRRRGKLWTAARLANRLVEAWYRQAISLAYQLRGYVVIYDRHVLLDGGSLAPRSQGRRDRSTDAYHWLMRNLYPRPDLVLMLDASGDVLFSRKGEASPEYLEGERQMYLTQAPHLPHFVRLDASQPVDKVRRDAADLVAELCNSSRPEGPVSRRR
jgi:thymidylate kinase